MPYSLLTVFRPFFDICLLRLAPQDLPLSYLLLAITTVTHLILGALVAAAYYPPGTSVLVSVTDIVLIATLVLAALLVQQRPTRFVQTLTAFTGTGTLLQAVALPLSTWIVAAHAGGGDAQAPQLLSIILLFWSVAIGAHILRNALDVRFAAGLAMAILFVLISWFVMRLLFPDPMQLGVPAEPAASAQATTLTRPWS